MRVPTSAKLIGKSIVLVDGTKSKIVENLATSYKTAAGTKVAARDLIAFKKGFKQIERVHASEIEDNGNGYVDFVEGEAKKAKPAKEAKAVKVTPKKDKAAKKEKTAPNKTPAKKDLKVTQKKMDKSASAKNMAAVGGDKVTKKKLKDVELTEMTSEIVDQLRVFFEDKAKSSDIVLGKNRITNALEIKADAEYAKTGEVVIMLGLNFKLAKPMIEETEEEEEGQDGIDPRILKKAAARLGKKSTKELQALFDAIGQDLPVRARNQMHEPCIVFGPWLDLPGRAVVYNEEEERFVKVGAKNLADYEVLMDGEDDEESEMPDLSELDEDELRDLVLEKNLATKRIAKALDEDDLRELLEEFYSDELADEEEEQDDEEEEQDDEEEEQDDEELDEETQKKINQKLRKVLAATTADGDDEDYEEEEQDDEEEEESEFVFDTVTKADLKYNDTALFAKNKTKLAKALQMDEEDLLPGLVLASDEGVELVFIGVGKKGIVVKDRSTDTLVFLKAKEDIASLRDFSPLLDEDEEEEEQEFDVDNMFDTEDEEDFDDMTVEELRDSVINQGLSTPTKAAKLNRDALVALLEE